MLELANITVRVLKVNYVLLAVTNVDWRLSFEVLDYIVRSQGYYIYIT